MSDDQVEVSSNILLIGDQLIQFDTEQTQAAYRSVDSAWSDQCMCAPCRNFNPQRNTAFPLSFLDLLRKLGIDAKKESEVYGCYPMSSGKRQYGGWFFFCGKMLDSGEGQFTKDGISYYVRGPGAMPAPGKSFEPNPLALEFTIEVPWILLDEDANELYGPLIQTK